MPECARSQERSVDASTPPGAAEDGAALERARNIGSDGGVPALVAAAEDGLVPGWATVVAAWELLRRETGESVDVRLHPKRWRQLKRALRRADRWCGGGLGHRGAGAELAIGWMEAAARDEWEPRPVTCYRPPTKPGRNTKTMRARNRGTTVRSLAHFGCLLDQTSRRWRVDVRRAWGEL